MQNHLSLALYNGQVYIPVFHTFICPSSCIYFSWYGLYMLSWLRSNGAYSAIVRNLENSGDVVRWV